MISFEEFKAAAVSCLRGEVRFRDFGDGCYEARSHRGEGVGHGPIEPCWRFDGNRGPVGEGSTLQEAIQAEATTYHALMTKIELQQSHGYLN